MTKYILRQILYSLSILWGIATLVFVLFNLLPGDPSRLMLGQRSDVETANNIRKELGFDLPLSRQYLLFLNDLSPIAALSTNPESHAFSDTSKYGRPIRLLGIGSDKFLCIKKIYLRRSYQSKKDVSDILLETFPGTAVLAISATLLAIFIGIILGVVCALKQDSLLDRSLLMLSVTGISMPSFVAALLILWVFAFLLGDFTGLPISGSLYEIDEFTGEHLVLKNLILPSITLGIRPLAIVVQLTRNAMLDVLGMDYVRTARAKGLSPAIVLFKHVITNSLNPVITAISGWLASLMAGAVFVEMVFGWKGLGFTMLQALNNYDLPVVIGAVLLVSVVFVFINILVDISYAILDPRIRLG
ncbi:MAG: ABC transporter permease [Bacteroidia bacterium]|nr:ABC transporter permease [Bacteroidia bacterium]